MTTKQSNREQTLLLTGIPMEKAEAAREALAGVGITFSPNLRAEHHSTREHLTAVFQAYDLHEILATLNDYLAFDGRTPSISDNEDEYDLGTAVNLIAFLDTSVEWCGREHPRDAISFIQDDAWTAFMEENPGIAREWRSRSPSRTSPRGYTNTTWTRGRKRMPSGN